MEEKPENFWRDQERPNRAFHERWRGKVMEVIDKYQPDMLWFDFQLDHFREEYLMTLFAHYFNRAHQWKKEVLVTCTWHAFTGAGMIHS